MDTGFTEAMRVLDFWFGKLDRDGMAGEDKRRRWFTPDAALDRQIHQDFGTDIESALSGELDHWVQRDDAMVALVILLDQFTRNAFRATSRAFSGDERALRVARTAIAQNRDGQLPTIHRIFLYIPFEHAEDIVAQDEGAACFRRLLEECPERATSVVRDYQKYCLAHRDVIARFGRFPHRNAMLGRQSSPEELTYLKHHKGF